MVLSPSMPHTENTIRANRIGLTLIALFVIGIISTFVLSFPQDDLPSMFIYLWGMLLVCIVAGTYFLSAVRVARFWRPGQTPGAHIDQQTGRGWRGGLKGIKIYCRRL